MTSFNYVDEATKLHNIGNFSENIDFDKLIAFQNEINAEKLSLIIKNSNFEETINRNVDISRYYDEKTNIYSVDYDKYISFQKKLVKKKNAEKLKLIVKDIDNNLKKNTNTNEINKNSILNLYEQHEEHNKQVEDELDIIKDIFYKEDVIPGFDSETEKRLEELMMYKPFIFKDVLEYLFRDVQADYYDKIPEFIEVVTNLNYKLASPANYTILSSFRALNDDTIQEAVIAGFEKWEDKKNIVFLKDMNYANNLIERYAKETIKFLEEL